MTESPGGVRTQAVYGTAWRLVLSAGQAVVQLAALAVLARLVAPVHFGVVALGLVVIGVGRLVAEAGLSSAIVQRETLEAGHETAALILALLMGSALAGGSWVWGPAYGALVGSQEVGEAVQVLGSLFIFAGPAAVALGRLQRAMRFDQVALCELIAHIVGYGCVGVVTALRGWGLWALVAANVTQAAVLSGIALSVAPLRLARPTLLQGKELMGYTSGLTLSQLFNQVALQADFFIVGRWLGAEALGVYNRAFQVMILPANVISNGIGDVVFAAMARAAGDRRSIVRAWLAASQVTSLLLLPIAAVLALSASDVVLVLLGVEWSTAVVPLRILAAGLVLRGMYKLSDSVVRATGVVYRGAARVAIYATTMIAFCYIGSRFGLPGVAVGAVSAMAVKYGLMARLASSVLGIQLHTVVASQLWGLRLALPITAVVVIILALASGLPPYARLSLIVVSSAGLWSAAVLFLSSRVVPGEARDGLLEALSGSPVAGKVLNSWTQTGRSGK